MENVILDMIYRARLRYSLGPRVSTTSPSFVLQYVLLGGVFIEFKIYVWLYLISMMDINLPQMKKTIKTVT